MKAYRNNTSKNDHKHKGPYIRKVHTESPIRTVNSKAYKIHQSSERNNEITFDSDPVCLEPSIVPQIQ